MSDDFTTQREIVRERNPLAALVEQHTHLRTSGRKRVGRCPFADHEDSRDSFFLYPNDSFFCFGCKRGGDVFAFVQHLEGVGFGEALRILAARAGVTLNGKPDPVAQKRACQLEDSVATAAARLRPAHRDYLRGRGLTDETIDRLRIGSLDDETILLPVLRYGRPVYLIDHCPDRSERRYRFPSVEQAGSKPIVGAELLRPDRTVYVCEGWFDWASCDQAELNAIALLGLGSTRAIEVMSKAGGLYLLLDGDDEGRNAAQRLARTLYPQARIVMLPDGEDPASLSARTGESFGEDIARLTESAEDALDIELRKDPDVDTVPQLAPLLARLKGAERDVAIQRVYGAVKALGVRKSTIREEVEHAARERDRKAAQAHVEAGQEPPPEPDLELEHHVDALLNDPDILERMVTDTTRLGHRGEQINRKMVFLSGVAGHTARSHEDAIHEVIKGDSSSGKNELIRRVLGLLPAGRVRFLTGVSEQALVYTGGRIDGVLVFQEAEGEEHADYMIRQAMSEGWLERWTVIDGETRIVRTYVAGSIITTTTAVALHDENQTRVFDLHTDEGPKLTREVVDAAVCEAKGHGPSKEERERILGIWRAALAKLEPAKVVFPDWLADPIGEAFPTHRTRARRDIRRTFNLMRACAILHQRSRERDEQNRIIAALDDYAMVYPLVQGVLGPSMSGFTEKAKQIAKLQKELGESADGGWVTRAELQREARSQGIASEKTVRNWCRRFTDMGVWEARLEGGHWEHRVVRDVDEEPIDLPRPDDLVGVVKGGKMRTTRQEAPNHAENAEGGNPGTGDGGVSGEGVSDTSRHDEGDPPTRTTRQAENRATADVSPGNGGFTTPYQDYQAESLSRKHGDGPIVEQCACGGNKPLAWSVCGDCRLKRHAAQREGAA